MKKLNNTLGLLLFALVLGLTFTVKPVQAATYRQIAYVNSEEKRLVLKFNEFCSSGYHWAVTMGDKTSPILQGSLEGGSIGSSKAFLVDLGKNYLSKTKYKVIITGKDKKQSIVVKYYTGTALTRASVSKTKKDQMKISCTINKAFSGSGAEFLVFKGADSTALLAGNKLTKANATTMSAVLAKNALPMGEYKTYTIFHYTINGEIYYGQGKAIVYQYLKPLATVKGIRLSTANSRVKISWNAVPGASYYRVYQSIKKDGKYKLVAKKILGLSHNREVKGGHTYYYKVVAVGQAGARSVSSLPSSIRSIKVSIAPGKVTGVKFAYDWDKNLVLRWSKTINTTGYIVYYKKATDKAYTKLGSTKSRVFDLSKLKGNVTYNIKVQAYRKSGGNVVKSDSASKALTIQPTSYKQKNHQLLLANSVRTIEHIGTKSIYTTRHYSNETKLAFINVGGYESDTDYLIWISHYTQQVNIFRGSKGKWKLIRTCATATGRAVSPSPIGVFKTSYKETGWYYVSTKELYVTHYCGRNSFHTRPLFNDGSVCTPTIGRPASHGCARLYNEDAKWIYDNIPHGTTVVSY